MGSAWAVRIAITEQASVSYYNKQRQLPLFVARAVEPAFKIASPFRHRSDYRLPPVICGFLPLTVVCPLAALKGKPLRVTSSFVDLFEAGVLPLRTYPER